MCVVFFFQVSNVIAVIFGIPNIYIESTKILERRLLTVRSVEYYEIKERVGHECKFTLS